MVRGLSRSETIFPVLRGIFWNKSPVRFLMGQKRGAVVALV